MGNKGFQNNIAKIKAKRLKSRLFYGLFGLSGGFIYGITSWGLSRDSFIYGGLAGLTVAIILASAVSDWRRFWWRRKFARTRQAAQLAKMSWRDFEMLVAELYCRYGFHVQVNSGDGPDGGVDILALRGPRRVIIQCKHWKVEQVGVAIVREMLGVMVAEKGTEVHIVTSGHFTRAAIEFAENQPIHLIDGIRLLEIMDETRKLKPTAEEATA